MKIKELVDRRHYAWYLSQQLTRQTALTLLRRRLCQATDSPDVNSQVCILNTSSTTVFRIYVPYHRPFKAIVELDSKSVSFELGEDVMGYPIQEPDFLDALCYTRCNPLRGWLVGFWRELIGRNPWW